MLISVAFFIEGGLLLVVGLLLVFRVRLRRAARSSSAEREVVVVSRTPEADRLASSRRAVTVVDLTLQFAEPAHRRRSNRLIHVTRSTTAMPRYEIGGRLADFVAADVASRHNGVEWPAVTEHWSVGDTARPDAMATRLEDLRPLLRRALVGEPISAAAQALGLHRAVATDLPANPDAAAVVRITGVVAGLAAGRPALTVASVDSAARAAVVEFFARAAGTIVNAPPGSSGRADGTQPPPPDGSPSWFEKARPGAQDSPAAAEPEPLLTRPYVDHPDKPPDRPALDGQARPWYETSAWQSTAPSGPAADPERHPEPTS